MGSVLLLKTSLCIWNDHRRRTVDTQMDEVYTNVANCLLNKHTNRINAMCPLVVLFIWLLFSRQHRRIAQAQIQSLSSSTAKQHTAQIIAHSISFVLQNYRVSHRKFVFAVFFSVRDVPLLSPRIADMLCWCLLHSTKGR